MDKIKEIEEILASGGIHPFICDDVQELLDILKEEVPDAWAFPMRAFKMLHVYLAHEDDFPEDKKQKILGLLKELLDRPQYIFFLNEQHMQKSVTNFGFFLRCLGFRKPGDEGEFKLPEEYNIKVLRPKMPDE